MLVSATGSATLELSRTATHAAALPGPAWKMLLRYVPDAVVVHHGGAGTTGNLGSSSSAGRNSRSSIRTEGATTLTSVVKVENPTKGGDRLRFLGHRMGSIGAMWAGVNRGKRAIAIDLQQADGVVVPQRRGTEVRHPRELPDRQASAGSAVHPCHRGPSRHPKVKRAR